MSEDDATVLSPDRLTSSKRPLPTDLQRLPMAISQDVLFRPAAAPSQAMTLAATSLGFVVVQLDVTIVNVALERIGTALGTGVAGLQWVVNAYTVVFASLILSSGALGDRLGKRGKTPGSGSYAG
jgi:hypothetical protein